MWISPVHCSNSFFQFRADQRIEIFPSSIGPATVSPLYFQPAGIFQYPGYAFFVFRRGMARQQDARRASFLQLFIDGFLQTPVWPRFANHIHAPTQRRSEKPRWGKEGVSKVRSKATAEH